ncbi:FRG domain-containing protein [Moraxella sp. ZY210820]|uniref:FRG domain-containing protein n=1 Tax=unclassified Moraxella TaxID=2685852 RepID=UPI002730BC78|nr:FRG domain-containing protein [Moraxella sp. ZY210820]WLF84353.1 FRG domain-containing protein [Moraxella sp. ZY210820]
MKIKTLSEFVEALAKVGECEKGKTRFFRGHSNIDYKLQPSIYRSNHLIANEHNIIKDVLTECHEYFSPHDTLFDKLVKMQHYGYPTRLLDITYNALVALYFSVSKIDGTDGEVIVFDIPNDKLKYHDSDTVAILSAISLQDKDFQSDNLSIESQYKMGREKVLLLKEEHEMIEYLQKNNNDLLLEFQQIIKEMHELPKDEQFNISKDITVKEYNSQKHIIKLLNDVRKDKPSFLPIIQRVDLSRVLCVKPKANNSRIIRQQGAFLIFGINDKKINQADLNPEWIVSQQEKKLIIDAKSKVSILNELKSFGINHQTLFPELDQQAEHIIARYKES